MDTARPLNAILIKNNVFGVISAQQNMTQVIIEQICIIDNDKSSELITFNLIIPSLIYISFRRMPASRLGFLVTKISTPTLRNGLTLVTTRLIIHLELIHDLIAKCLEYLRIKLVGSGLLNLLV